MPSIDYYLQELSNPSLTSEERQKLNSGFNAQLFDHALDLIQKRAAIHGVTENHSEKAKDGRLINGVLQYYHMRGDNKKPNIIILNIITNAYFQGENQAKKHTIKASHEALGSFTEDKYQGFALACLENFGKFVVANPYSQPYYYGKDLIENLCAISVERIPFIFVPIINNTIYSQFFRKHYQAQLYLFASNKVNDFADEFTPPYHRVFRRTILSFEALKLYEILAVEVSELFLPECRKRVKARIIYSTVFNHLDVAIDNLLELLQKAKNNLELEGYVLIQYQELFKQLYMYVKNCTEDVEIYINNLDTNSNWRFEQSSKLKDPNQISENLPFVEADKELVIYDSAHRIGKIINKLRTAQELSRSSYVRMTKIDFSTLLHPSESVLKWRAAIHLSNFKCCLEKALNDRSVRTEVLNSINNCFYSADLRANLQILSDEQLVNIYSYILHFIQKPEGRKKFLELNFSLSDLTSGCLITCKTAAGLPRTVSVSLYNNIFRLSLHSSRKIYDGRELLPKFKGHAASVTPQFDISPYPVYKLEKQKASKSIDIARSDANPDKLESQMQIFRQNVEIARSMGRFVAVISKYTHMKTIKNPHGTMSQERRVAVRLTEDWALCNLYQFCRYELLNDDRVLKKDIYYKTATTAAEVALQKERIILRLIADVLQDFVKLHDQLKVIHKDVKPDNILLFIDGDGRLRARLSDFDMSEYMHTQKSSRCQPAATCSYASPEVVGFYLTTDNVVLFPNLREQLKFHKTEKSPRYASFGRELLIANWSSILNKAQYKTIKHDYKDDMFSLGVTLFEVITGCYPTLENHPKGQKATGVFNYMHTQEAYNLFPQFKQLLQGLLRLDRGKRFSAQDALIECDRIKFAIINSTSTTKHKPCVCA